MDRDNREGWATIVGIFQVFVMLVSAMAALVALVFGGKKKLESGRVYDEARSNHDAADRRCTTTLDEYMAACDKYNATLGGDFREGSPAAGTPQALAAKAEMVEARRRFDAAFDSKEAAFGDYLTAMRKRARWGGRSPPRP